MNVLESIQNPLVQHVLIIKHVYTFEGIAPVVNGQLQGQFPPSFGEL